MKNKLTEISAYIYMALMLWLMFGQRMGELLSGVPYSAQLMMNINLIPFKTIFSFISALEAYIRSENAYMVRFIIINLLGNIIMFVPMGFFIACVAKRGRELPVNMLYSTAVITALELTQLFTLLGSFDVDDLILNLVGTTAGWGIYKLLKRRTNQ